jgi:hypothetical protein
MAINDAGQTAGGGATTGDTVSHACLWDPESGIGDLDDGSETRWSQACGMNSSGDVVGTSSYAAEYYYESYAMLWKDGAAKRLGAGGIYGFDVNDASDEHGVQIAGRILTDRGWGHAALWEIDAEGEITATDLDELLHPTNTGEGILGSAMAINARGQIVTAYGRDGHVRVLTPSWMLPPPPSPPASPSAAGGSEHVAIRWSPVETADSYAVKRATASGGPYDTLASGLTSVSEYLDRTASLGSTYFYVVTAENAAGESDPSSEVSAAPRPFPPPNLAAVLNRSRYGNQVNLRWSLSPSANVVQYKVYRRAIPKDVLLATLGSVTSTTVKELARGTTYTYCITAVHASGRESLLSKFASVTTP